MWKISVDISKWAIELQLMKGGAKGGLWILGPRFWVVTPFSAPAPPSSCEDNSLSSSILMIRKLGGFRIAAVGRRKGWPKEPGANLWIVKIVLGGCLAQQLQRNPLTSSTWYVKGAPEIFKYCVRF